MINIFLLVRDEDETGVSGSGVVAAGLQFPDGHVVMRWLVGEHKSSVCWDSIESVKAIHGHNGKTRIVSLGDISQRPSDNQFGSYFRLSSNKPFFVPEHPATITAQRPLMISSQPRQGQFKGLQPLIDMNRTLSERISWKEAFQQGWVNS